MMAWTQATAEDVQILGFRFACTTPDGEVRKPKFGDVGGIYLTNLPQERKSCLEAIDRKIYSCTANTTFISNVLNRKYASCLPVFEKQAYECAAHFDRQRPKCDAGSEGVNQEAHASDAEPEDVQAEPEDVQILGFRFACTTPDGEVRKPKFGDVDGIYLTNLPQERKSCLETIDRMIYSCTANTTFVSNVLNRKYAGCLPIFEKQAYECAAHFDRQRSKCDAGSEGVNREAHVSDTEPVEDDAWNTDDDGECKDVWADCPVDADSSKEQQLSEWEIELGPNFDDPLADVAIDPDSEKLGYESYDAIGENRDTADSARDGYERALAELFNEDASSTTDHYSEPDNDYLAVLNKMDDRAKEKARLQAEKAAAAAAEERAAAAAAEERAAAAAQQELQASQGDGSCGSSPASMKYIRHGERVTAQVQQILDAGGTDFTNSYLLYAFVIRSVLGCLRKSLPYETDACKSALQPEISAWEEKYRSMIASAKTTAVDLNYVNEFDRDPFNSEIVRKFGIHISGANIDSCGD